MCSDPDRSIVRQKPKICVVTTTPLIVNFFLREILAALALRYDLTLIVNLEEPYHLIIEGIELRVLSVRIERKISLSRDILALIRLVRIFLANDFHIVHSIAPKAGLLGMIAAWISRTPNRIHTFQGETWATRRGVIRFVLKVADYIIVRLASHILVVSSSEQDYLISQGLIQPGCSTVLGKGSISGVDITRFRPDAEVRSLVRQQFSLRESDFLFLFLGRLTRDKGILDLVKAFATFSYRYPHAYLLIVGPDEENLTQEIKLCAGNAVAHLRFFGLTDVPEHMLAAADVVCLPSYREAFGMVILEAAASGIPAIASRIYGITDALEDGKTGMLHRPRDVRDLASKMRLLIDDNEQRQNLGRAAHERAHAEFSSQLVIMELMRYYEKIILHARK